MHFLNRKKQFTRWENFFFCTVIYPMISAEMMNWKENAKLKTAKRLIGFKKKV